MRGMVTMKTGLNDARHVVWATRTFFFFPVFFLGFIDVFKVQDGQ